MTYEVVWSRLLIQGSATDGVGSPEGQVIVTTLSDGTFFVVVPVRRDSANYMRLWHLDWSLSVMGSIDIVAGGEWSPDDDWWSPYAVATSANKVLLIIDHEPTGSVTTSGTTWVVDCSDAVPVITTMTTVSLDETIYEWGDNVRLYDAATDRVFVGAVDHDLAVLQVFSGTTGEVLCEVLAENARYVSGVPAGIYLDPNDPTRITMPALPWSDSGAYHVKHLNFTVSLDGRTGHYDGKSDRGFRGSWWGFGGSPYLSTGGGWLTESLPYDVPYSIQYLDYSGRVLASHVESGTSRVELYGDLVTYNDGRYLITAMEVADDSDETNAHHMLWVVDQLATPPTIEALALPWGITSPNPKGNNNGQVTTMDISQMDGTVVVATGVKITDSIYATLLWTVCEMTVSDLSGQHLSTDVYFHGG
jgi:hypothetical protein